MKKVFEKLKNAVTSDSITIHLKNVGAYSAKSIHRYIFTTNSKDPLPTSKDDRRFNLIRSSDEKIGDTEYFDRLHAAVNDPDTLKQLYVYFMSKNFATEVPQAIEYRDFRSYLSGTGRVYTVNGREVNYNQWITLKENYDSYVSTYNDIKARKRNYQLGAAIVYILNVIDTMILTHKYNSKLAIEKKISLDAEPFSYIPTISLNYRF